MYQNNGNEFNLCFKIRHPKISILTQRLQVAGRQDHHHRMYSKRPVGEMKSRSWLTSILGTTEEEKGRGSNANRIVSIGPQVFLDILFKAAYLVLFFLQSE